MKLSCINYSLVLASVLALGIGCNSANPQDVGGGQGTLPVKDIPAVSAPTVHYKFYEPETEEGLKNDTNYGYLIAKVKPGFKTACFEKMGFAVMGGIAANGAVYHRLYKESGVLSALNRAKKYIGVIFIEPEMPYCLHAVEANPVTLNNPDKFIVDKSQHAAFTTKAYDAWIKYGFGNPNNKPIVASIDTGVRWRHNDLIAQVRHAFSWFLPTSSLNWTTHAALDGGTPLDAEGMVGLLPDFKRPYNGAMYYSTDYAGSSSGHGTHTSGTIIATGNNGAGVAGVCWNNELIHYKGFDSGGYSTNWSLCGSLWHLARWKEANNYTAAIPVNASYGGSFASLFDLDMITHGLQHGIIMVASAGNDGQRMVRYPAAFSGVIAVGASTGADKLKDFSCYGPHLSVVAPGDNIVSTYDIANPTLEYLSNSQGIEIANNSYQWMDGTSMSAPQVTGLIGYMLNFNPTLKVDQIKTCIEQNADFIDGETGFSDKYGWGRINVLKTIEAVIADANSGATPPSNYVLAPVKVKAPTDTMSDISVYLYNCSEDGAIQNYVASAIIGEYITDALTGGREANIAYFNMLKPGRYIAKAAYFGAVAATEPFNVSAAQSQTMEVALGFGGAEIQVLTIQTFPTQDIFNSNYNNICDPVINISDSTGAEIAFLDEYFWDTLRLAMPGNPGDYYIHITDYYGNNNPGEYAMWVTTGATWAPDNYNDWVYNSSENKEYPVAPGDFASPTGGAQSAQAQSRGTAQTVDFNRIYYARFNGAGGTGGAVGHWYKFNVQ